jgi:HK97 family phage major capsid protein/HK97 family phage prohead protease
MADLHHATATLEVKADAACRTLSGIAATPTLDRQGHIFDINGATFADAIPLLLHHDQERPIGTATLRKQGTAIHFEAQLAEVDEPGPLRDLLTQVRQQLKSGLIKGVSIGWKPLADGLEYLKSGVLRIVKSEICELSLVTVPANRDATILRIKSADVVGPVSGVKTMKPTTAEHIQNLENKRAALAARMTDIMEGAAGEGQTLEAEQATEHDGLTLQVKSIDADLARWRDHEKLQIATATPVPAVTPLVTSTYQSVSVKANVPIGTQFVRAACARMLDRTGMLPTGVNAITYAEQRWKDTPEVALYLKAAVAPGTATDATWASPLVNQNITNDFIALLRPATILGKIPGLRVVPFNTKVPSQSAGGTYGWVGESKPKPVTKLAFTSTSLGISKAAGIIVLTKELIMLSNPDAEDLVRKDMVAGIAQFLDAQFIDPAVAAVAGVNPASITNGAPTAAATTNPMADIMGLIAHFATNNIAVDGVAFIMSAANALSLSFRSNLDGSPQYPGLTINGGTYKGLTFITSQAAGTNVIALQPALVLYADGGIEIDASQEASLQMDSAPASPADATTVYVSLWQTNTVGLRAERFVNWAKANANAVKYLTATAWPAPTGAMPTLAEE